MLLLHIFQHVSSFLSLLHPLHHHLVFGKDIKLVQEQVVLPGGFQAGWCLWADQSCVVGPAGRAALVLGVRGRRRLYSIRQQTYWLGSLSSDLGKEEDKIPGYRRPQPGPTSCPRQTQPCRFPARPALVWATVPTCGGPCSCRCCGCAAGCKEQLPPGVFHGFPRSGLSPLSQTRVIVLSENRRGDLHGLAAKSAWQR